MPPRCCAGINILTKLITSLESFSEGVECLMCCSERTLSFLNDFKENLMNEKGLYCMS